MANFLLNALQSFWASTGSPGNTSSPLILAPSALKLTREAEAYEEETLDIAEKLAEVLASVWVLQIHSDDFYMKCLH